MWMGFRVLGTKCVLGALPPPPLCEARWAVGRVCRRRMGVLYLRRAPKSATVKLRVLNPKNPQETAKQRGSKNNAAKTNARSAT